MHLQNKQLQRFQQKITDLCSRLLRHYKPVNIPNSPLFMQQSDNLPNSLSFMQKYVLDLIPHLSEECVAEQFAWILNIISIGGHYSELAKLYDSERLPLIVSQILSGIIQSHKGLNLRLLHEPNNCKPPVNYEISLTHDQVSQCMFPILYVCAVKSTVTVDTAFTRLSEVDMDKAQLDVEQAQAELAALDETATHSEVFIAAKQALEVAQLKLEVSYDFLGVLRHSLLSIQTLVEFVNDRSDYFQRNKRYLAMCFDAFACLSEIFVKHDFVKCNIKLPKELMAHYATFDKIVESLKLSITGFNIQV